MPEAASDRQGGRVQDAKTFEFDRVFGPESTQAAVFDEVQVRLLLRLAPSIPATWEPANMHFAQVLALSPALLHP